MKKNHWILFILISQNYEHIIVLVIFKEVRQNNIHFGKFFRKIWEKRKKFDFFWAC